MTRTAGRQRGRAAASFALVVVGVLLLMAAAPAVWAHDHLLDSQWYAQTSRVVLEEPEVLDQLARQISASIADAAGLPEDARRLRSRTYDEVRRVLASERFADAWEAGNQRVHARVTNVVRGEDRGFYVDGDAINLDVGGLVQEITPQLAASGLPFASRLPRVQGTVTLVESQHLGTIARVVRALDDAAGWLPWAAVGAMVAAVVVAPRRRRAVLLVGVATVVGMAVLAGVLLLGRASLEPAASGSVVSADSWRAVFDAFAEPLFEWMWRVAVLGAVLAALAALSLLVRTGRR